MGEARLIFIEGMTGAGKSTTAGAIERWYEEHSAPVRRYHEMDDDNPIRTKGVDAMRSNHPQAKRLSDVGEDGFALDPSAYGVGQWGALARGILGGESTVILESRYVQNSVQPRYIGGAPKEKVLEGFARIHAETAVAQPLFIYLRPTDIRAHLRRTLDERSEDWGRWLSATFSDSGWARSRSISGDDALFRFYEDWEVLAEQLFAEHTGPKIWLDDPQVSWDHSMEQIFAFLER